MTLGKVLNRKCDYSVLMITALFVDTYGVGRAVSLGEVLLGPFPDQEMETQRGSDSLKGMAQIMGGPRI